MKVKAIATDGKVVYGVGFSKSPENNIDGREIGYLFKDCDWIDGAEFSCLFDLIFMDTLEIYK